MDSSSWKRWRLPAWLLATSVLLVLGWTLPAIHTDKLVSSSAHSILGGILRLVEGDHVILGIIIFGFSVVFPAAKVAILFLVWARRVDDDEEKIHWLGALGKWSMLDVYVVAIFAGAVRLGILAEFEAEPGIYVFAASVLMTMIATKVVERRRGGRKSLDFLPGPAIQGGWVRALSLAAAAAFALGASQPLMRVEKWLFWSSEYSLFDAVGTLLEEQLALGGLLGLFVLVLPGLQILGVLCARWIPSLSERAMKGLVTLEEWAMLDTFALAMLVVVSQLAGMVAITPRAGLWWLLAAALVSALDVRLLRSALQARSA